jgi:conjugal transfer/entry exclusion protein
MVGFHGVICLEFLAIKHSMKTLNTAVSEVKITQKSNFKTFILSAMKNVEAVNCQITKLGHTYKPIIPYTYISL